MRQTRRSPLSLRRAAKTHPAEPPPTTTTSNVTPVATRTDDIRRDSRTAPRQEFVGGRETRVYGTQCGCAVGVRRAAELPPRVARLRPRRGRAPPRAGEPVVHRERGGPGGARNGGEFAGARPRRPRGRGPGPAAGGGCRPAGAGHTRGGAGRGRDDRLATSGGSRAGATTVRVARRPGAPAEPDLGGRRPPRRRGHPGRGARAVGRGARGRPPARR